MEFIKQLFRNQFIWISVLSWFIAQAGKIFTNYFQTKEFDIGKLIGSGGMPSSHSALVSALATAIGLTDGFDAPYAMIAVGFGLLVLCDAATLRREAGEHARLLNKIIATLNASEEVKIEAAHLEEVLGHRRREVLVGVCLGIVTAFCVCAVWDFWK